MIKQEKYYQMFEFLEQKGIPEPMEIRALKGFMTRTEVAKNRDDLLVLAIDTKRYDILDKIIDFISPITINNFFGDRIIMYSLFNLNKNILQIIANRYPNLISAYTLMPQQVTKIVDNKETHPEYFEMWLKYGAPIQVTKLIIKYVTKYKITDNPNNDPNLNLVFGKEDIEATVAFSKVDFNEMLESAILNGNKKMCKFLIDKGADILFNDVPFRRYPYLLVVAAEKSPEMLKFILEQGITKEAANAFLSFLLKKKDNGKFLFDRAIEMAPIVSQYIKTQ